METQKSYKIPVLPEAAGTTEALSRLGYSPPAAICDIIDNSIQAGAKHININVNFTEFWLTIRDDGKGMSEQGIIDALTYGKKSSGSTQLGKFGMGLKTAGHSLGRRIEVYSFTTAARECSNTFIFDKDEVIQENKWEIISKQTDETEIKRFRRFHNKLIDQNDPEDVQGTMVRISKLEHLLETGIYRDLTSNAFEKACKKFLSELIDYIGLIYHRFIEQGLNIYVENKLVVGVNPGGTELIWDRKFPVTGKEFEEDMGISLYYNPSNSGLFVYREDRLIDTHRYIYGLKRDTTLQLIFDISENLDNLIVTNLQKTQIERYRLDSSIIETLELKIKESKKWEPPKANEAVVGDSTSDVESTTVIADPVGINVPESDQAAPQLHESQGNELSREVEPTLDIATASSLEPATDSTRLAISPEGISEDTAVEEMLKDITDKLRQLDANKLEEVYYYIKNL